MDAGGIVGIVFGVLLVVGAGVGLAVLFLLIIYCKFRRGTGVRSILRSCDCLCWQKGEELSDMQYGKPRQAPPITISLPIIDDTQLNDPGYRNTFDVATNSHMKTLATPDISAQDQPHFINQQDGKPKEHNNGQVQPIQVLQKPFFTSAYADVVDENPTCKLTDDGYCDPRELGILHKLTTKEEKSQSPGTNLSNNAGTFLDVIPKADTVATPVDVHECTPTRRDQNALDTPTSCDEHAYADITTILLPLKLRKSTSPYSDEVAHTGGSENTTGTNDIEDDDYWGTRSIAST